MKKVLITGASSGIGQALAITMVNLGFDVWGVARRKGLQGLSRYTTLDLTAEKSWDDLFKKLKANKFIPDIVIFNAARSDNDLTDLIDLKLTKQVFDLNFYSILKGINILLPEVKKGTQFIAISSSSAFKGNCFEGIGYCASKAALTLAFESLYQKYQPFGKIFKTVFFGPVNTKMSRFSNKLPFTLSVEKAAGYILEAINGNKNFYYYPGLLFTLLRLMKALLPTGFFLSFFAYLEKRYNTKNDY